MSDHDDLLARVDHRLRGSGFVNYDHGPDAKLIRDLADEVVRLRAGRAADQAALKTLLALGVGDDS